MVQWKTILKSMARLDNTTISDGLINCFLIQESTFLNDIFHLHIFANNIRGFWLLLFIFVSFGICLIPENNYRSRKKLSVGSMFLAFIAFVWGFICLSGESVFVYFNF